LYPGFCWLHWTLKVFYDPLAINIIDKEFRQISSEELIKKLHTIDPISPYPGEAMQILAERREKKAVTELMKFLKSWHPDRRYRAIGALGLIGDDRAVEPLLKIVNDGEVKGNKYYRSALLSLCEIGYKPMHSIVVERLQRIDGARNGSTRMMKYIGKREDLPILEDMLEKIQGNDAVSRIDRGGIKDAINAIKQRENIKGILGTFPQLSLDPSRE